MIVICFCSFNDLDFVILKQSSYCHETGNQQTSLKMTEHHLCLDMKNMGRFSISTGSQDVF